MHCLRRSSLHSNLTAQNSQLIFWRKRVRVEHTPDVARAPSSSLDVHDGQGIDPFALFCGLRHFHLARHADVMNRYRGTDAFLHQDGRGKQARSADTLAAMDDDIPSMLQFMV